MGVHITGVLGCAGTLRSCDPDRVVLKKVVLAGYPVKVHKKKAVVRWMFHNPDDVRWFKPLELWTKYGRRGQIKVTSLTNKMPDLLPTNFAAFWLRSVFF